MALEISRCRRQRSFLCLRECEVDGRGAERRWEKRVPFALKALLDGVVGLSVIGTSPRGMPSVAIKIWGRHGGGGTDASERERLPAS